MYTIISIIAFVCAVWVHYEVWAKQKMSLGAKIIWTIFAFIFNIGTAIDFYFVKKS